MSIFSEQVKTSIGLARDEANKKITIKIGKTVGEVKPGYRYDIIINGELIPDVSEPKRTEPTFEDGTAIILVIPSGNESGKYISEKSEFTLPEQTVSEMSTKKRQRPVADGYIYLCCPEESLIKRYSFSGVRRSSFSGTGSEYYCCTDGTYIYFSSYVTYLINKINISNSEYSIILDYPYDQEDCYGLAISDDFSYLYLTLWSGTVKKIRISDGQVETLVDGNSYGSYCNAYFDLRGDGENLYLLGNG